MILKCAIALCPNDFPYTYESEYICYHNSPTSYLYSEIVSKKCYVKCPVNLKLSNSS